MSDWRDIESAPALPGDDLSYYLGPDAICATQEQCDRLEAIFAAAHADVKRERPPIPSPPETRHGE